MKLKIGTATITRYSSFTLSLSYDSVASTFGAGVYFDPEDEAQRDAFRPCRFAPVTVEHEGEQLLAGTLLSHNFRSSASRELLEVGGYSRPGVLEDCEIPQSAYPLQSDGLSLKAIAEKIIAPFGLKLVIDPAVQARATAAFKTSTAGDGQTCKAYLAELAGQRNIILSHDAAGNLVLTEAATGAAPAFEFVPGMPGVTMALTVDGQQLHSEVTLQKQATKRGKGNAGISSVKNPLVPVFRPRAVRQTSGENVDTADAARGMLCDDLKGITLTIELDRWRIGGKLIRPNSIITVQNPDLFLFSKARFFVASVEYKSDTENETASITCHLPEAFSGGVPKNIFA